MEQKSTQSQLRVSSEGGGGEGRESGKGVNRGGGKEGE